VARAKHLRGLRMQDDGINMGLIHALYEEYLAPLRA
jgi:hypothetical protein